jgi:hypothetical protein
VPFAVNAGAVATPLASVITVLLAANVPLAPLEGAMKVTDMPDAGLPDSVTVASSATGKAALIGAVWGLPAVALIA